MKLSVSIGCLILLATVAALGCKGPVGYNLPPAERLMHPGPGVGGPGPGVLSPAVLPASFPMMPGASSQVLFSKPEGMQVRWVISPEGMFDSVPLIVPGRSNFPQGGIYRLKLTNIPGREGVELYPTLEVGPAAPRTEAFLAHNALPVQFTEEDFDQVLAGNFVTKVIYLPDPEFQELAFADIEELVSTRLEPGLDPVTEADRRGSILAIIRIGNKDVEMPGSMEDGAVMHASFEGAAVGGELGGPVPMMAPGVMPGAAMMMPGGAPGGMGYPPTHVSGVTIPPYGMPISGTPIGLPGPPHIPLGVPAGLQKHVMRNHTHMNIPDPVRKMHVHVKQQPGLSYPKPAEKVNITEQTIHPMPWLKQPLGDRFHLLH